MSSIRNNIDAFNEVYPTDSSYFTKLHQVIKYTKSSHLPKYQRNALTASIISHIPSWKHLPYEWWKLVVGGNVSIGQAIMKSPIVSVYDLVAPYIPNAYRRVLPGYLNKEKMAAYALYQYLKKFHRQRTALRRTLRPCSDLRATIYTHEEDILKQLANGQHLFLKRKRIERLDVINRYEGTRFYPRVRVSIKGGPLPTRYKLILHTHPISHCKYAKGIARYSNNVIIVEDGENDVVAAIVFKLTRHSLEIKLLCSANLCAQAGTAAMYVAHWLASQVGKRQKLVADPLATTFYHKTGFSFDSNNNHNNLYSETNTNNEYSRRVAYPFLNEFAKMVKYTPLKRPRNNASNSNANNARSARSSKTRKS